MVKKFQFNKEDKGAILNKYIRVNVRHRAFKCWLAQTSGFILLATVAILYLTTEKNHPVYRLKTSLQLQLTCFVRLFHRKCRSLIGDDTFCSHNYKTICFIPTDIYPITSLSDTVTNGISKKAYKDMLALVLNHPSV